MGERIKDAEDRGDHDVADCDALRTDPLFKLAVGRAPESGRAVCSQPTMSRLENAPSRIEVARMTAALVDLFCRSFDAPPVAITLDNRHLAITSDDHRRTLSRRADSDRVVANIGRTVVRHRAGQWRFREANIVGMPVGVKPWAEQQSFDYDHVSVRSAVSRPARFSRRWQGPGVLVQASLEDPDCYFSGRAWMYRTIAAGDGEKAGRYWSEAKYLTPT